MIRCRSFIPVPKPFHGAFVGLPDLPGKVWCQVRGPLPTFPLGKKRLASRGTLRKPRVFLLLFQLLETGMADGFTKPFWLRVHPEMPNDLAKRLFWVREHILVLQNQRGIRCKTGPAFHVILPRTKELGHVALIRADTIVRPANRFRGFF